MLAQADVDSITALGSTGAYAYLDADERARVAKLAVEHAGSKPVFIGVGALRTSQVLRNVAEAEDAGAAGVLLAPMSYLPLTDDDVFELYRTVAEHASLPIIVYDNPGTTHVAFTNGLYGRIATLPHVVSIKIPGVPRGDLEASAHVEAIRRVIPDSVTVGVSGDPVAVEGLLAGCDVWYSVVAGTLPALASRLVRAVARGDAEAARGESERLAPLWDLFAAHGGSTRVIAVIAECLGLVSDPPLPLPIQGLQADARDEVLRVVAGLGLG